MGVAVDRDQAAGPTGAVSEGWIKIEARWIGGLLSRLSDRQLQDAFRAANYNAEEVRLLAGAVRKRINELTKLQPTSTED